MQSADSYLSELAEQLTQLKMALSRSLSSSDSGEQQAVRALIDRVAGLPGCWRSVPRGLRAASIATCV